MNGRIHRVLGTTGAALAGIALLAGGALAADRPNDRAGAIGVGGVTVSAPSDVIERAINRHVAATLFDPFEHDVAGPVRPDDRSGARGAGLAVAAQPSTVAIEPGDGFAWGDAAFAVAATFGLLVAFGAVATLTLRHRGRALAR